jgi:hypothetical protein
MASLVGDAFQDISKSNSSSSSSDEKMLQRTCRQHQLVFATSMASASTMELLNMNEVESNVVQSIDQDVGVQDVLTTMQATPNWFKTLTNFSFFAH